jgi:hypothetical protein
MVKPKGKAMKIIAAVLTLLSLSTAFAQDNKQDNKYVGTGMSVTGPASEKKPASPVTANPAKSNVPPKTSPGANGTSVEETPGTNSATSNSH